MEKTTPVYFKEIDSMDYIRIGLKLKASSQPILLERLFEVAIRYNKKRIFLFVSKLLGKHLAVDPKVPLLGGRLLADYYAGRDLKEGIALLNKEKIEEQDFLKLDKKVKINVPTLIIGFAETATGLGHSVFASCEGNISYIHTTRENIVSEVPTFVFEETHSHATSHRCFGQTKDYFRSFEKIILVDDEITTGHTALHLIEALFKQSGNKHYVVMSILDWRSKEQEEEARRLEVHLDIKIDFISLVQGEIMLKYLKPLPEDLMSLSKPTIDREGPLDEKIEVETLSVAIEDEMIIKTTRGGDGKERHLAYMRANGRFGLTIEENEIYEVQIKKIGEYLKEQRRYKKCLVIGTEEYIYIPNKIAYYMGEDVKYQSSTRSPIIPNQEEHYPIQSVITYKRPEDSSVVNYLYNILPYKYEEIFWIMEREVSWEFKEKMIKAFKNKGIRRVVFVIGDGNKQKVMTERAKKIQAPRKIGSYSEEDCIFLLKEIEGEIKEKNNEERERAIQKGVHYSEMLPVEYRPTKEYVQLYKETLTQTADQMAAYVGSVAEMIYKKKGDKVVLVSLARAGTPVGVLIKRYLKQKYQLDRPHFSISIMRDKGIDENALLYLLRTYEAAQLQFIDGWTGKGVIGRTLTKACKLFEACYKIHLDDTLAVLCDPGECTSIYGTRADVLVPSACLNATVSGLVSRTFLRKDMIGFYDFHGAKYYREWMDEDLSNEFIEKVSEHFEESRKLEELLNQGNQSKWNAEESVNNIIKDFQIEDINRIKPGVGETTRVLLRRLPWKILVKDQQAPQLQHILLLAKERGVPIENYQKMCYACCGLIKKVKE